MIAAKILTTPFLQNTPGCRFSSKIFLFVFRLIIHSLTSKIKEMNENGNAKVMYTQNVKLCAKLIKFTGINLLDFTNAKPLGFPR